MSDESETMNRCGLSLIAHRIALIMICFGTTSCSSLPTEGVTNRTSTGGDTFLLEAAYRTQDIAILCFVVSAPGQSGQRRLTLTMPMPDGVWELPKSSTTGQIQWAPGKENIAWKRCNADGQPMKILEVKQGQTTKLPGGINEAIYVAYRENMVAALGYVSVKPFFGEHHSYTLVLSKFLDQVDEQDDTFSYAKAAKELAKGAGEVGAFIGTVVVGVLLIPVLVGYAFICGQPGMTCDQ